MASVLVVSMPFAGHAGPLGAVAAELVARGHDVTAYTGAKYGGRFTAIGATWLPWTAATDFDDADLAATFPRIGDGKGMRGARANGEYVLLGTAAGQAEDILAAGPFDLVVTDQLAFGGAFAAERLGVPWATVAVTPITLTSRDLPPTGTPWSPGTGGAGRMRDAALRGLVSLVSRGITDPRLNRLRAGAGLGPVAPGRSLDATYSPHLVIAQGVPGLEYPRSDLPATVHFVGRLAPPHPAGNADLPPWWPELATARAVVHVTQGTLDVDPAYLLKPALAALAEDDLLVVCTTGGADPATLGPMPANARASAFLPHHLLLPEVDAMVTNGGWGGVLGGLSHGVPLVVAGDSLDKPEVARRVAYSGAGIDLRTGSPKPAAIGAAVRRVVAEPAFRDRAAHLGSEIAEAGGAEKAADLIEGLLRN